MSSPTNPIAPATNNAGITGQAYVFFAFDIGFQVDLEAAAKLVQDATRHRVVRARRPAPTWFDYSPPPLRLVTEGASVEVGGRETEAPVGVLLYDFGAAILTYRLPLPGTMEELPAFGEAIFNHGLLEQDARERAARLTEAINAAVERPRLSAAFEDYTVFSITGWPEETTPKQLFDAHRAAIAGAIEAEQDGLAEEQIERATCGRMSYGGSDLSVIDWNGAVLIDREPEDVLAVLQHANVELLELRVLDEELDSILDHADETLAKLLRRRFWPSFAERRMLGRFASVQTDTAVMFEGVNNAIKLLGNQYLARLYRQAASRLDLPAWQQSVQRKLEVTESLYQKMSDATGTRRLETLEWVIIALIAISIVLPFTPIYH